MNGLFTFFLILFSMCTQAAQFYAKTNLKKSSDPELGPSLETLEDKAKFLEAFENMNRKVESLLKEKTSMKRDLEYRSTVITSLKTKLAEMEAENAELKTQLQNQQETSEYISYLKQEHLSDIQRIVEKVNDLVKVVATNHTTFYEKFTSQVDAFQATVDEINTSMMEKEEEMAEPEDFLSNQ